MSGLQFINPWVLYLLWLAPVVGAWWYVINRRREERLSGFISIEMQKKLRPDSYRKTFVWQTVLITFGLFLILIAAGRPQWGTREEVVYQRGRDLVIALDVSRSMLASDVRPSRLLRAKADIMDLLKELKGDRAALIAFRRTGVLLCPLTTDYVYLRQALEAVDTESAPRGETNLGDAIAKALDAFDTDETTHRAIILISDGEDLAGKALAAADKAAEKKIPIFTVGIGDPKGARIPEQEGKQGFVKRDGQDVLTKLDNDALYAIAKKTGGAYLPIETASMTSVTLGTLYRDHLSKLAEKEQEETLQRRYVERYQYFLLPAILLLLAGVSLSRGRLAVGRKPEDGGRKRSGEAENRRTGERTRDGGNLKSQISNPRSQIAAKNAASFLLALVLCVVHDSIAQTNDVSDSSTNVPVLTTNVLAQTPEIPSGRDGARVAQKLYVLGKYDQAASAYIEAARGVSGKSQRDFRYNAAAALFKAGKYDEAADILKDISHLDAAGKTEANMGLGSALYKAAATNSQQTAEQTSCKERALREAGEAFKEAVRDDSDNETARRNLAVVVRDLPEAEEQAKTARLVSEYQQIQAPQIADKMLAEQKALIEEIPAALTNNSPSRIAQMEDLAKRQEANADLWIPLKGKLLEAISQQASTNAQQQMAGVVQLVEATRDTMLNAAENLKDLDPAGQTSANASRAAIYQLWKFIAPYQLVLQEDLRRQSNIVANTGAAVAGKNEKRSTIKTEQTEAAALTELFTKRFAESVPEGGEMSPPPQPAGDNDKQPPATEKKGISAETRKKILDLAAQAQNAQESAVKTLEGEDFQGAQAYEQISHELLKEIENLLPKDQNKQQQQQDQKQEQQQKQEQKQEQRKQEQQQQPEQQQQAEEKKAEEKKQEDEKKDATPEDVKKLLEKAIQREREHQADVRKRNAMPPSPIDRDW